MPCLEGPNCKYLDAFMHHMSGRDPAGCPNGQYCINSILYQGDVINHISEHHPEIKSADEASQQKSTPLVQTPLEPESATAEANQTSRRGKNKAAKQDKPKPIDTSIDSYDQLANTRAKLKIASPIQPENTGVPQIPNKNYTQKMQAEHAAMQYPSAMQYSDTMYQGGFDQQRSPPMYMGSTRTPQYYDQQGAYDIYRQGCNWFIEVSPYEYHTPIKGEIARVHVCGARQAEHSRFCPIHTEEQKRKETFKEGKSRKSKASRKQIGADNTA